MYSRYQPNYSSKRRSPYSAVTTTQIQPAEISSVRLPRNYSGTAINNRFESGNKNDVYIRNRNELDPENKINNEVKQSAVSTVQETEPDPDFTFPRWDHSGAERSRLRFKNEGMKADNSLISDKKSYPHTDTDEVNISDVVNRIQNTLREDMIPDEPVFEESGNSETVSDNPGIERSDGVSDSDTGGRFNEIKEIFKNINLSSSDLLLITLIIYLLSSHSDDEMVILLLILLVLGF